MSSRRPADRPGRAALRCCCGSPRRSIALADQPPPPAVAESACRRRAEQRDAAADRAPHLALLRDLRDGGRQHAAAGQFPGRPEAGRRAPHVADQHRPLPALAPSRRATSAGSALRDASSASRHARHHAADAAVSRALLQLVRHARPAAARPAYVSTVDSGNLAGHLIALANACREWQHDAGPRGRGRRRHRRCAATLAREALRDAASRRDDRCTQALAAKPRSTIWKTALRCRRPTPLDPHDRDALARGGRARLRRWSTWCARLASEHDAAASADLVVLGRRPTRRTIDSWRAICWRAIAAERSSSSTLRSRSADDRARDGARRWTSASCSTRAQAALHRLSRHRRHAGPELLRPARFRGAARELLRHRQGRCAGAALVPARPHGHADRRGAALVSWSGSMFEYLMPSLVMRAPAGSLLEQTSRLIVQRQIDYGARARRAVGRFRVGLQRARPGVHLSVLQLRRAGPGPKRGLSENMVIAPYATGLAAMVDPRGGASATSRRWQRSARAAATASTRRSTSRRRACPKARRRSRRARLHGASPGHDASSPSPMRCSTARMRERFHAEPIVQATELLLQERTPRDVVGGASAAEEVRHRGASRATCRCRDVRRLRSPHDCRAADASALERPLLP